MRLDRSGFMPGDRQRWSGNFYLMKKAGRVVIIIGAAGGIGRAPVDTLAADGDTVVAVDLPGSGVLELARGLGPGHLWLEFDVSREEDIPALYDRIERQFGQVGVLVNKRPGPTMAATVDTTTDGFRRNLAVNLIGPIAMDREAARHRQCRLAGRRARQSQTQRLRCLEGRPDRVHEIAGMAVCIVRHSRHGGSTWYVRAPMVSELEREGKIDLAAVRSRVPMGRVARPDEIAGAVRFLASAQASYITGSVPTGYGGWSSLINRARGAPQCPGRHEPNSSLLPSTPPRELRLSWAGRTA